MTRMSQKSRKSESMTRMTRMTRMTGKNGGMTRMTRITRKGGRAQVWDVCVSAAPGPRPGGPAAVIATVTSPVTADVTAVTRQTRATAREGPASATVRAGGGGRSCHRAGPWHGPAPCLAQRSRRQSRMAQHPPPPLPRPRLRLRRACTPREPRACWGCGPLRAAEAMRVRSLTSRAGPVRMRRRRTGRVERPPPGRRAGLGRALIIRVIRAIRVLRVIRAKPPLGTDLPADQ